MRLVGILHPGNYQTKLIEFKEGEKNCANFIDYFYWPGEVYSQPAFTCSKLTIETLEQGMKYVQSQQ